MKKFLLKLSAPVLAVLLAMMLPLSAFSSEDAGSSEENTSLSEAHTEEESPSDETPSSGSETPGEESVSHQEESKASEPAGEESGESASHQEESKTSETAVDSPKEEENPPAPPADSSAPSPESSPSEAGEEVNPAEESASSSETAASSESGAEASSETSSSEPETTRNPRETQYPENTVVDEALGDYGPDIRADTYCVLDGDTGEVLMSCGKDKKMYPASCTKIMTALLVLENVKDLNDTLTFTKTAINIDPSSSTLEPKAMTGETMTVKDALYGMFLKSANECGAMLGEYVGGSEEAFAEMMNQRAAEIGCVNTHFMNAYGIHHPEHYTTAYDLALILREAMKNEAFRELNATKSYTIPVTNYNAPRTFGPGHQMLNGGVQPQEGITVIGGKTGSTPQAGKCLTTAAEKDGFYTVSTLMKSDGANMYADELVLLEFAYALHEHAVPPVEWVPVSDHVTAKDGLRIRYSPSLYGGVDYTCDMGSVFERTGIYGEWSRIIVNDHVRYVATAFVDSDDPEHVPVTEAYVYVEPETEEETEKAAAEEENSEEDESEEGSRASGNTETGEDKSEPGEDCLEEGGTKKDKALNPLVFIIPGGVIAAAVTAWAVVFVRREREIKRRRELRKKHREENSGRRG